jgi:hypothetical protein
MRALGLTLGAAAVAAGCSFSSPKGSDPDAGGTPDDGQTTTPDQAPMPDAQLCYGAGLGKVCLSSLPTQSRNLSGSIDTSNDGSCDALITITGTEACVVTGTNINVMGGIYRARGDRPLVVVATGVLAISSGIDVGSERGGISGAGSSNATCTGLVAPGADNGGGGGGAGGSFIGAGGTGGLGDGNDNGSPTGQAAAGTPNPAIMADQVTQLRAGCRGGSGGSGGGGSTPGSGGRSGGIVYLIAGTEIQISGRVLAYGAGGSAGSSQGGAGGGGSGGMIGLDAPSVKISGYVIANGGGGGEGGGAFNSGGSGDNGRNDGARAGGGMGSSDGGNGGNSSGGPTPMAPSGENGTVDNGGGGGGGGGAGLIYVKGQLQTMGGSVISPAAYQAPAS